MECSVCLRSMSSLKRLIDLDKEAKQVFLLISDVSHIRKNDVLCKVCLSLLQSAAAFREICIMSDLCFSRRKHVVATEAPQNNEFVSNFGKPIQLLPFVKIESKLDFDNDQHEKQNDEDEDRKQEGKDEDDDSDFNYPGGDDWDMDEPKAEKQPKLNKLGKEATFTCDICGKNFKVMRSFRKHLIKIHKQQKPNAEMESSQSVACYKTSKLITSASNKKSAPSNKKQRPCDGPGTCGICGKIMKKRSITRHILTTHTSQLP